MVAMNGVNGHEAPDVPGSNYILPGSSLLPAVSLPHYGGKISGEPEKDVQEWLDSFNAAFKSGHEGSSTSDVFLDKSYWRDLLCLTWDFRTLHGREQISSFTKGFISAGRTITLNLDKSAEHRKPAVAPIDFSGSVKCVRAFLNVDTDVGRGKGVVKLVPDDSDGKKWKAFTLFTTLEELQGHEELIKSRRPAGVRDGQDHGPKNWKDERDAQQNFEGGREPTVLIIGAGQGGLSLAARLKQLGVEALIIDRNARVGDNWRNRYHQLVLHDSVWYDHMPYLSFPPNWPTFTPKDKLAEWFEYYAMAMELNVWTSTNMIDSSWSDEERKWTLTIERQMGRQSEKRTFHPRHVVLATGHSGEPNLPTDIKGVDEFQGDRIVHSSQFNGPEPNTKGKKAVVVGCCNSGHDIARDYYEHGYDVTMVQRSSTLVVTCETLFEVTMKGLYSEDGPPTEDADIINYSSTSPVGKISQIQATHEMQRRDAKLLNGLTAAGFALDSGPDKSGLWNKYVSRGGGYYIDVGTSSLIASGAIKIAQGSTVSHVAPHSLVLEDGRELPADEIVFATGYKNMRDTARKVFGDELADRVNDVWGLDKEGEIRTMWRRSGHPGFWFFGGNLALCRFYSRLTALQIKALEVGVAKV